LDKRRAVIAGCGFLGEAAAGLFLREGWEVLGICRTAGAAAGLGARGIHAAALDISEKFAAPDGWGGADVVVHCASSGGGGAGAYRAVYRDGMERVLEAFAPRRVVFVGSTSVYAQGDGMWVDEDSPAEPVVETGRVLLEAERIALAAGGVVARLGGIYGPGRAMYLQRFLEGSAVLEDGGGRFINLIHRDDGAAALVLLAGLPDVAGIFNVVDGTPATQRQIYGWLAEFFGRPLPPEGPADPNRKRGLNSKCVRNTRLRSTGWAPEFPSYKFAIKQLAEYAKIS
jgi:nucleoside-diphosphate-sugar epimerase